MASNKEKMLEYIAGQLEEGGLYSILSRDNTRVLVRENPDAFENPHTLDVLVHSRHTPVDEVAKAVAGNTQQGIYTAHIFLKDGITFMVRLAARGNMKNDKSLKHYTKQQIDAMIHLRDLEKAVISWSKHPQLAFYQPQTARLQEGIRTFELHPVYLDYSHLKPGDNGFGFAVSGISDDFKLPAEIGSGNGPIELVTGTGTYVAGVSVLERPVRIIQGQLI